MKLPWFYRRGIFFIPKALMGWLIALAGVIYAVYVFIDIDSRSHSASDTLVPFSFNILIMMAVYSAIGYFTSKD